MNYKKNKTKKLATLSLSLPFLVFFFFFSPVASAASASSGPAVVLLP